MRWSERYLARVRPVWPARGHILATLSATESRSESNRSAYTSGVIPALACPSILCTTFGLAPAEISQFKVSDDSNQSLLGPPAVAAVRQLLSVPVTVTATVPDDLVLVADRKAVLSAYGVLTLAVSEHAAFRKDNIVTRLTWRIGAVIADPKRVVELRVPSATPEPVKKAAP